MKNKNLDQKGMSLLIIIFSATLTLLSIALIVLVVTRTGDSDPKPTRDKESITVEHKLLDENRNLNPNNDSYTFVVPAEINASETGSSLFLRGNEILVEIKSFKLTQNEQDTAIEDLLPVYILDMCKKSEPGLRISCDQILSTQTINTQNNITAYQLSLNRIQEFYTSEQEDIVSEVQGIIAFDQITNEEQKLYVIYPHTQNEQTIQLAQTILNDIRFNR